MRPLVVVSVSLAALSLASPALAKSSAAPCEALAASPDDPETAEGKGVALADLDFERAITVCERAAAEPNAMPRTIYHLGRAYDAAQRYEEAAEQYEQASGDGLAIATYELGALYSYGAGVATDPIKAQELYEAAYEDEKLPVAAYNIAYSYQFGEGVDVDLDEAARYYEIAYDGGNVLAANQLGVLYETGQGVEQDDAKAVDFYKSAADRGNAIAANNLGVMYEDGRGDADAGLDGAKEYYGIAADLDYGWGQVNLARLIRADDAEEADALLTAALDDAVPEAAAAAHNALAWSYVVSETKLDEAVDLAREATNLDPASASAYDTLAWALHLTDDNQAATAEAETAVRLGTEAEDSALWAYAAHLGDISVALNQNKLAVKSYRQALDLAPTTPNDPTVDLVAIEEWLDAQ